MGAGAWTSRVAGWGLVLWLSSVAAVEAQPALAGPAQDGRDTAAAGAPERAGEAVPAAQTVRRVRANAAGVYETASLLAEAARRSETIQRMLVALEETDLIVYVELARSLPNRSGCLTFVTSRGDVRMLRISIDMRNIVDDQVKWLGHEMVHALEVSGAPEVRDSASLGRLFQRIGHPVEAGSTDYETDGAVAVGHQVKAELARVK